MTSKRNAKDNFMKKLLSYISTEVKFWLMQVRISSAELIPSRGNVLILDSLNRNFCRQVRAIYYDPFFHGTKQEVNTYQLLDSMLCGTLWKVEPAALSSDSDHNMIKSSSVTRKVIALGSSYKKRKIMPAHLM